MLENKNHYTTSTSATRVVIATVPFIDDHTPLAAPAVLKASLQKHGIWCKGLDLNIEIYNKIKHRQDRDLFLDFFWKQIPHEQIVDDLTNMLYFYVEEILSHRPTIVALSLFCYQCQAFAAWLCATLRYCCPEVKIVIGGPGLQTLQNSLFKYPDRLKQLGLIDDYITGDGETSLVEYCKGNLDYPGINSHSWIPNENFDLLPAPDFSDYRFFRYNYPLIPIVDSRGCVQSCEFCDVIAFWNKFQYLSAENIFAQMKQHMQTYGLYRFQFSSSICNGNMKEFKKVLKLMAEHNANNDSTQQIHWIGSFIVRPATQHREELYKLIKQTNGFLLTGIESVIEKVRIGLGKKFTNADLDHHLKMCAKHEIKTNLLCIACYPTETDKDQEQVKQWFANYSWLAGTIVDKIQLTTPAILPGTKLEKNIDQTAFNLGNGKRVKQAIQLAEHIRKCGFEVQTIF